MEGEEYYLYGKITGKYAAKEDKENKLVIYTTRNLGIFENTLLSSLEGIFVSNEYNLEREEKLSWFLPQMLFQKDKMRDFEIEYNGKFFPFKK